MTQVGADQDDRGRCEQPQDELESRGGQEAGQSLLDRCLIPDTRLVTGVAVDGALGPLGRPGASAGPVGAPERTV